MDINIEERPIDTTPITTEELLEELKALKEEIRKLQNQKEPNSSTIINDSHNTNNNITINNTQNNITNNNQNVILVAFGKENFDAVLTQEDKIKIFERGLSSVIVLTEHIHFNEKIPQYNGAGGLRMKLII